MADIKPQLSLRFNILESAFGNIGILNIIISYLRQEEIIVNHKDGWCCNAIPQGSLSNLLKNYINGKYYQLEEHLKRTLQQSSLIGKRIELTHLRNAFSLPQAEEWLTHAERLSGLIKKEFFENNSQNYLFENDEVYQFVKKSIPEVYQKKWLETLISYYSTLYETEEKKYSQTDSDLNKLISLSIKVASYNMEIEQYTEAINYYIYAINYCFQIMNYNQSIILIEKAKKITFSNNTNKEINLFLDKRYAECYEFLGLYSQAKICYKNCIDEYYNILSDFDIDWYRYKVAFCTYYSSLVNESFNLTYNLKVDMEKCGRKDSLYFETLSLLSTLYMEKSNIEEAKNIFINTLAGCKKQSYNRERFILQRKSDIYFNPEKSIHLIEEAKDFFKENGDIKEYAKAIHNIGADLFYIGDSVNSEKYLYEALDIFNSFGSIDALYPYNCLGIFNAIYNNDFNNALNFFKLADYEEMNAFKKIAIWLNKSICYQKIGDFDSAWSLIEKCEQLEERKINNNIAHYYRVLYINKALFYKSVKDNIKSLYWFKESLNFHLKDEQLYIVSKYILDLSIALDEVISEDIILNCNMSHSNSLDIFIEKDVFFYVLRFLE